MPGAGKSLVACRTLAELFFLLSSVNCLLHAAADGGQNPTWNETLFFQISNEAELLVTVRAALQHAGGSS